MTDKVAGPIVDTKTFATRARTIDHLGREQIADCPTAVSELWKNSWDAYARKVLLRIYDEEAPVAVLTDDGHGMRENDLFDRWLVIGTESKSSDIKPAPVEDRNGLPRRIRQGQKGIGRLSSAKLGSVLLLITKYKTDPYVAALLDWRMFENPFLNLSDVVVATGKFKDKSEIFKALPTFADTLAKGVVVSNEDWKSNDYRVREEWARYDNEWLEEHPSRTGLSPSKRIISSMRRLPFRTEHLADWEGPGTAMLVFDLDDTLKMLPASGDTSEVKDETDERFQTTLSNFVDPYTIGPDRPEFSYRADIRKADGADGFLFDKGHEGFHDFLGEDKAFGECADHAQFVCGCGPCRQAERSRARQSGNFVHIILPMGQLLAWLYKVPNGTTCKVPF